jgi:hypothetical protein
VVRSDLRISIGPINPVVILIKGSIGRAEGGIAGRRRRGSLILDFVLNNFQEVILQVVDSRHGFVTATPIGLVRINPSRLLQPSSPGGSAATGSSGSLARAASVGSTSPTTISWTASPGP